MEENIIKETVVYDKQGEVVAKLAPTENIKLNNPGEVVQISLSQQELTGAEQVGDNLVIHKANDEKVEIEDFFKYEDTKLVVEDEGSLYVASYSEPFDGLEFTPINDISEVFAETANDDGAVWVLPLLGLLGVGAIAALAKNGDDDDDSQPNPDNKYQDDAKINKLLNDIQRIKDELKASNELNVEKANELKDAIGNLVEKLSSPELDVSPDVKEKAEKTVVDNQDIPDLYEQLTELFNNFIGLDLEGLLADAIANEKAPTAEKIKEVAEKLKELGLDAETIAGKVEQLKALIETLQAKGVVGEELEKFLTEEIAKVEPQLENINIHHEASEHHLASQVEYQAKIAKIKDLIAKVKGSTGDRDLAKELKDLAEEKEALKAKWGQEKIVGTQIAEELAEIFKEFNAKAKAHDELVRQINSDKAEIDKLIKAAEEFLNDPANFNENYDKSQAETIAQEVIDELGQIDVGGELETGLGLENTGVHFIDQLFEIPSKLADGVINGFFKSLILNVGDFFRDLNPLDIIKNVIPDLISGGANIGTLVKDLGSLFLSGSDFFGGMKKLVVDGMFKGIMGYAKVPALISELAGQFVKHFPGDLNPITVLQSFTSAAYKAITTIYSNSAKLLTDYFKMIKHGGPDEYALDKLASDWLIQTTEAALDGFKHFFANEFSIKDVENEMPVFHELSAFINEHVVFAAEGMMQAMKALTKPILAIKMAFDHFAPTISDNVINNLLEKVLNVAVDAFGKLSSGLFDVFALISKGYKFKVIDDVKLLVEETVAKAGEELTEQQKAAFNDEVQKVLDSLTEESDNNITTDNLVADEAPATLAQEAPAEVAAALAELPVISEAPLYNQIDDMSVVAA